MKKTSKNRLKRFLTACFAWLLVLPGIVSMASDLAVPTFADGNNVYFSSTSINNNQNIFYNEIIVKGMPNEVVKVTYRTVDANAIAGVDYVGISNTVSIKINNLTGTTSYPISVKCLNDSNTRQLAQTCETASKPYGRYFNLELVSADNATIVESGKTCKCFLPYTVSGISVTAVNGGEKDPITGRRSAYINEYKEILTDYYEGTDDIDGKETWKSWVDSNMSINSAQTDRWINSFINTGLAEPYASILVNSIDDSTWQSSTPIDVLVGNKQFMSNYSRSETCPGLFLYFNVNPDKKGGYHLNNKAMYWISQKVDPTSKQDKLVNVDDFYKIGENKRIYFIQSKDMWFASKDTLYDLVFYKTAPYEGTLDLGIAVYNGNKECDRQIDEVTMLATLVDSKAPTLKKTYATYDYDNEAIRFYLRFSEPVYATKGNSLTVKVNNHGTTPYYATFVEGNYTDTLVYSLSTQNNPPAQTFPRENIDKLTIELPDNDIADLAYNLDENKKVNNNMLGNTSGVSVQTNIVEGNIDLTQPRLSVDLNKSTQPCNIYNLTISANNGDKYFNEGTVYYKWDKESSVPVNRQNDPTYYDEGHILTSEERGSFFLTLVKNESKGIDRGNYYLHALAVSPYGYKDAETFGPYNLDGDNPVVEQIAPSPNLLQTKIYNLAVNQKGSGGAKVKNVTLYAKYKEENGADAISSLDLYVNSAVPASMSSFVEVTDDDINKKDLFAFKSNINMSYGSIPVDHDFIPGIMGTALRLELEVYFVVEDTAGNKTTSNSIKTVYDKRTLFEVEKTIPAEAYVEDTAIDVGYDVYNIANATSDDGITYSIPNDTEGAATRALIDEGAEFSVIVTKDGEDTVFTDEPYSVTVEGLEPGYYDCVCSVSGMAGSVPVDLVSDTTSFYLTNGLNDGTANKEKAAGDLVLANKVYELDDEYYYFFDNDSLSIVSHPYGATLNPANNRYEGGSNYPAFSSAIEAKKYVKYMEYQDMHLMVINDTIASILNTGTGSTLYVKAAGETKTAQEGQLWIRYKRSSWTAGAEANAWAFYYYSDGNLADGININDISSNLASAIDTVTTRIVGGGKDVFLVTEDTISQTTGAPYLAASQMHAYKESVATTKTGIPYVTELTFNGDSAIFVNTITHNDQVYPLATNMALSVSDSSTLYYKYGEEDSWHLLNAKDGQLLKDVLPASGVTGVYTIREYSNKGVSEFSVYVDKSKPTVHVTLDDETEFNLDDTVSQITCKSLTIDSMTGEDDPQAYVAIYSYPYKNLEAVLYGNAVSGYVLTDGNYYLQIGDRSGNIATYTVLTSDTNIELSVEENDAKTGVYVKVNNRSSNEIYSYEVYVNEVLIDTEFENTKFFREAGMYRVVVTDIYGNTETAVAAHTTPTPEITWYFLNDNESYSQYSDDRPGKMILMDDETNPRVTYVYTSTLLKLAFNDVSYESSTVQFELLDIENNQYYYNAGSGLLTISALTSFRLRVWYESNPENDHTYICIIDNDNPSCTAQFIGTSFSQYVLLDENDHVIETSTFDIMNFDAYQDGDVLSLDCLDYVNNGTATLTFENGSIISGSHIVIGLKDPSGIRSYSVTRNGTPVEIELDADDQLLINDYGYYVITVYDKLGNVTIFTFTNVKDAGALGLVDDLTIEADNLIYGHDNLTVETLYPGVETILVETVHGSYTYEFHYDGHVVTYGIYLLSVDQYEDDQHVIQTEKSAYFEQNIGFALNYAASKTNSWYSVIAEEDFTIYAMFDDDGHVYYKVESIETEIKVESSFTVGNSKLPDHYVAVLSREQATLTFLTGGQPVIQTEGLDIIYITNDLTIDANSDLANITKITYAYNQVAPAFGDDDFQTIYENGAFVMDFAGTENGFYRIIATNKYNNQTIYLISKITTFASNVVIHVLDGSSVTYYTVDGPVCSNYSIELYVYSDNIYFEVNGIVTSGVSERGVTILEIARDGLYDVRVIGENGIFEDFTFEIKNDETFLYEEDWITGYNTEALLADQGYTNTKCSINVDDDVIFIDYVYNDEIYVKLYDTITDDPLTDPNLLIDAIGALGPGKYEVGFRNKYGDLVKKTVYFSDVPSLTLERIVTTDPDMHEVYPLQEAIINGFYSNYVLIFSTNSSTYVFKINDTEYRLDEPKTIEFTNISGIGSFEYKIDYLDEYGNHVSFLAVLYRDDVEIDTSLMKTIILNTTTYTKDDVSITFEDGLFATVSVNGGAEKPYASGDVFYADGTYRFTVEDIAGNQVIYTIVHKSMNHYTLTTGNTETKLVMGGVVNNTTVVFSSTDGSKITQVVRNGELMADYSSNTFSSTGHWELLIEDSIGNVSYEEFYIINNELAKFDYAAPYGYKIAEVWRIDTDGTRALLYTDKDAVSLTSNGNYIIVVAGKETTATFNFSVSINVAPPTATLVGVEEGGITARDVTLSGLKSGDVVKVYKDGELVSTTVVSLSTDTPTISTGGRYRIVVTNLAGVTTEYTFTRKAITNVAGSVFVIATCALLITGIGIGLLYHTRLKTDDQWSSIKTKRKGGRLYVRFNLRNI